MVLQSQDWASELELTASRLYKGKEVGSCVLTEGSLPRSGEEGTGLGEGS